MLIYNPLTSPHQQLPQKTHQQPQVSRIPIHLHAFQENPYTFEVRYARLSEPLEPVVRQAPLIEPQYEPTYDLYPHLQQDLHRTIQTSQVQNTLEINRQIIHPRRNRKFQTLRVLLNIPQSPISSPLDLSSSKLPETPPTASQQSISNIPSDYLGSTPTSQQIRENPFNNPTTTERPPYWVTNKYPHDEPNLVNNPVEVSFDTTLSLLPETLSISSTASSSQISPSTFPLNFLTNLDSQ